MTVGSARPPRPRFRGPMTGTVASSPSGRARRRRFRRPRLDLAVGLLGLVVGSIVTVASSADARAVPTADSPPQLTLTTPVLSVRRIAAGLVDLRAGAILKSTIDAALATPALGSAEPCVIVRSGGRTLYSVRAEAPRIPASTMKLLTATAALAVLGPDHTFTTKVGAAVRPTGGVISGDLWLVGGGDPILQTAPYNASLGERRDIYTPLEALADDVVEAGVKTVTGSVVGDESRYDSQRAVLTWKPTYLADAEAGPLSALMVNQGLNEEERVPNPVEFAATTFTALLQARGVQVAGPPKGGTAPAAVASAAGTVASLQSAPVRDVVGEMLRMSDNTTAELLVKEIGRAVTGRPGTTLSGTAAMKAALAQAGFDVSGLVNIDGSGLDRGNRVTCGLLAEVLGRAGRRSLLADQLPISGRTGTLRDRLVNTPAAGRVAAKTGSLDDVSALAGWVDPKAGAVSPPLVFSFIADDLPNRSIGPNVGDRVSLALASWPEGPPASAVVPLPLGPPR